MATVGTAEVELRARTAQFVRDMNAASQSFRDSMQTMQRAGRQMTRHITLPIAAVGAASFKMAGEFEANLARIEGLVGVQRDQLDAWRGDIRSLAVEYGRSANEAADALFFITSAGLRGSDAMDVLEASLKASQSGLGEVKTIADLSTSAMNAYGIETLSAAEATDVLTAAVREGKLEPAELAGSMGRVLPIASNMGVAFDEVGAAMAAMSRTGTNAQESAVQLRQILVSLLNPTEQAREALRGMGLSAAGIRQQIRDEGLLSALQTLAAEFEHNDEAATQVFGNVRALAGVLDMMGTSAETTEEIFASLSDSSGALDEAFSAQQTAVFELRRAWAAAQDLLLEIGEDVLPRVHRSATALRESIQNLTERLGEMDETTRRLVVTLAALAAALGPILTVVGLMGRVLMAASVGLGAMAAKFAVVTTGVGGTVAAFGSLLVSIRSVRDAVALLSTAVGRPLLQLLGIITRIHPAVAVLSTILLAGIAAWRRWGSEVGDVVLAVNTVMMRRLEPLAEMVRAVFQGIVEAAVWLHDQAIIPIRDFAMQVSEWLVDFLGPIVSRSAELLVRLFEVINPAAAEGARELRDFADEVRGELARMRAGAEVEVDAVAQAIEGFQGALRGMSGEELELTATGLGANLIEAERELARLEDQLESAMGGSLSEIEAASEAVQEQRFHVAQLRASYEEAAEAAMSAARSAREGAEDDEGGGGLSQEERDRIQASQDIVDSIEEQISAQERLLAAAQQGQEAQAEKERTLQRERDLREALTNAVGEHRDEIEEMLGTLWELEDATEAVAQAAISAEQSEDRGREIDELRSILELTQEHEGAVDELESAVSGLRREFEVESRVRAELRRDSEQNADILREEIGLRMELEDEVRKEMESRRDLARAEAAAEDRAQEIEHLRGLVRIHDEYSGSVRKLEEAVREYNREAEIRRQIEEAVGLGMDPDEVEEQIRELHRLRDELDEAGRSSAQTFQNEWLTAVQSVGASLGGVASQIANVVGAFATGGPVAGIAAGVGAVIGGLSGRRDRREQEQARLAEEAERAAEALGQMADRLRDITQLERDREENMAGFTDAIAAQMAVLSQDPERFTEQFAEIQDEILEMALAGAEVEEILRAITQATTLSTRAWEELEEVIEDFVHNAQRIEEQRQEEIEAMQNQYAVLRLLAAGHTAEADELQRQIEREKELAQARKLGDENLVKTIQRVHEMQDAAREAARAFEELLLNLDLDAREAALAGDDVGVVRARAEEQRQQELKAAEEAKRAGEIGEETYLRWVDVIEGEFVQAIEEAERAMRDAARAAWEQAEAERFRQRQDFQNLRVRLLRAQGLEEEAMRLQQMIELENALREGRDSAYIQLLQQIHAEELRNAALQRTTESARETADSMNRVTNALNAPQGLRLSLLRHHAQMAGTGLDGDPMGGSNGGGSQSFQFSGDIVLNANSEEEGRAALRGIIKEANAMVRSGQPNPFTNLSEQ